MGIEDGISEAADQAKKVVTGEDQDEQQNDGDNDTDDSDNANMEYERDDKA
ncbi:hypothetical protein GCM10010277_87960 [Streptomyces longisporoflavus]|uniref:hypothetical protein n=1 Tax=Streptomyces longisporoflavus TaxID=28044 RepID=UPI00167DED80|nr:hypothetical protein [Streptomyces longisporoflavus]GGV73997.1 hypothetical protein GCM10010277_87960 [Streptomyces longisporoflavus]